MPDRDRIAGRLQELWEIARGLAGGADRPAFSTAEAEAMLLVAGWAREAGLEPGIDPYGNLWALPIGWRGPVVTAGSHVDTVPDGGRYDGALGTVLGLELVDDLSARLSAGVRAGLLICAAEEAPRFAAGTVGSRLLVGTLSERELERFRDAAGVTAAQARVTYLDAVGELPRVQPALRRVIAHAEVHVAQRRALRELGVVTKVAAPRRLQVLIAGSSGHAGELAMEDRHDALAAAAELVLAVEAAARAEAPETVATVGEIAITPGAVSVVPGTARLTIDARAISGPSLDRLEAAIRRDAAAIAQRRGVTADLELVRAGDPVELDPGLADAAVDAARSLGVAAVRTWSGSGHDAQHLAAQIATLLVFVPLHGGESHTPEEDADIDEIIAAAEVVAEVLARAAAAPTSSAVP